MDFFKKSKENTILDYKLRNILIDYFKQIDTLSFQTDNRFIIRN